jgi:hypothetical protein
VIAKQEHRALLVSKREMNMSKKFKLAFLAVVLAVIGAISSPVMADRYVASAKGCVVAVAAAAVEGRIFNVNQEVPCVSSASASLAGAAISRRRAWFSATFPRLHAAPPAPPDS